MSKETSTQPRRLGRPPGSNRADRNAAILQAALACFARAGYQSTTNQDVATRAGVTTGALYHYFDSKEDLYVAVFESVEAKIFETYRTRTAEIDDFYEVIDTVLDASVQINREDSSIAAFWINLEHEARRHPELAPLAQRQRADSIGFWRAAVERGRVSGSIAPAVDDETTVHVITSLIGGLSRMSVISFDLDQHRRAAEAIKLLLRGTLLGP